MFCTAEGSETVIDISSDVELTTTKGTIALANLQTHINSLETQATTRQLPLAQRSSLIDLIMLRGQILGQIADYERAAVLAEQLVYAAPSNGSALLARARTLAAFHDFSEALSYLDAAERLNADQAQVDAERATILQGLGYYTKALTLRSIAAERQPTFATLGALAGVYAERGEVAEAECLFSESRRRYEDMSPFPLARIDVQRGLMWLEYGDLDTARVWLAMAHYRVPNYAMARGYLAEVDLAIGDANAALRRLRPLAAASDDPKYAGQLADLLSQSGQVEEAQQWRRWAAARYDELLERHPAAFADQAAEFWLAAGDDPHKALHLAQRNLAMRQTPRAYALVERAARASASNTFVIKQRALLRRIDVHGAPGR